MTVSQTDCHMGQTPQPMGRKRFSATRLRKWMACPLQAHFRYDLGMHEQSNAAAVFGTIVHKALEELNTTNSFDSARDTFLELWDDPERAGLRIDYWPKYTSYGSYREKGLEILARYFSGLRWDDRTIVQAEHPFLVPFGAYELTGIIDLLELRRSGNGRRLLRVVDFKSGFTPNATALAYDAQLTLYLFAADQREFWVGNGPDFPGLPDGERLYEELLDVPRRAIWYQLSPPKEIDAGPRGEEHFLMLYRLCEQIDRSQQADVYIPRIGEACAHCLAGETRFLTSEGVRQLKDSVGPVRLMTDFGRWADAKVEPFGRQALWRVRLRRHREAKEVFATAEHRWLVKTDRRVDKTTVELEPGDHLVATVGQSATNAKVLAPSAFGIARGIVFGDGSVQRDTANVSLYGPKRELVRYYPLSPLAGGKRPGCSVPHVEVRGLPAFWKFEHPSLGESKAYLYGWLAGYFATDGSISDASQCKIGSARRENVEFVRDVCYRLGIVTHRITTVQRKGLGRFVTPYYATCIASGSLSEAFFLREDQRRRFKPDAEPRVEWSVEAVERTERVEEVFCAVVPGTHTFVLEDNVLTGNCSFTAECGVPFIHHEPDPDQWL